MDCNITSYSKFTYRGTRDWETALRRDFTSNRPGLLRYREACLREGWRRDSNGREKGRRRRKRFRSNKFSMLQALGFLGLELVNRRIEGVLALITIVLDFRWEERTLPNRWKIRLPRNETFSETNPLPSLSLSLCGTYFVGWQASALSIPSDSVKDKFTGTSGIDRWHRGNRI